MPDETTMIEPEIEGLEALHKQIEEALMAE